MLTRMLATLKSKTKLPAIFRFLKKQQPTFDTPDNYAPIISPTKAPQMPIAPTIRMYASAIQINSINAQMENARKAIERKDFLITNHINETRRLIN